MRTSTNFLMHSEGGAPPPAKPFGLWLEYCAAILIEGEEDPAGAVESEDLSSLEVHGFEFRGNPVQTEILRALSLELAKRGYCEKARQLARTIAVVSLRERTLGEVGEIERIPPSEIERASLKFNLLKSHSPEDRDGGV